MKKIIPPTEKINNKKLFVDELSIDDALKLMIDDQAKVIKVIKKLLPQINYITNSILTRLKKSDTGRIIYTGAGTSGRIAVQDGVELYPTFGWPKARLDFIIAGGKKSLTGSIENAEDNILEAKRMLNKLSLNKNDVVIGLAASGNTPFTNSVIKEASLLNCLTIGISNNPDGEILKNAKIGLTLSTGSEIITGSTRMKAGTSQKITLNLISTMLMILLKRIKKGQMTHMIPTNQKLKDRELRIKSFLGILKNIS